MEHRQKMIQELESEEIQSPVYDNVEGVSARNYSLNGICPRKILRFGLRVTNILCINTDNQAASKALESNEY